MGNPNCRVITIHYGQGKMNLINCSGCFPVEVNEACEMIEKGLEILGYDTFTEIRSPECANKCAEPYAAEVARETVAHLIKNK